MKKFMCVLIALALALPVTSSAFDGNRKGFVLGGGLGVAPYAKWGIKDTPFSTSNVGAGGSLFLGYAWNEMNMMVWEERIKIAK